MRIVMLSLLLPVCIAVAESTVSTPKFTARFERGALTGLTAADGVAHVKPPAASAGGGIHRVSGDHWAQSAEPQPQGERLTQLSGLDGAEILNTYRPDPASGEIVLTQDAHAPEKGLWGVEWSIEGIPLDHNIILPANSGLRLTRSTPGSKQTFDYPMTWEAQMLIVEGAGSGFYVWAEDTKGRYKRLTVERNEDGWRLGFITMPNAPFEDKDSVQSVRWRLGVYRGDWCAAAKPYRDWMIETFQPTRVAEQRPAWVRDTRACVIMPLDQELLTAMAHQLDPKQTLLYLYDWRQAGYDRDYPTYDQPRETLRPFLERARELGFRCMLHVNYFGCDPLNPLYAQFEPFQVRSPWGDHDKEWWLWTRAEPAIKFAYINPACKAWRDLFIARMTKLCTELPVDALHLDQTLCIYNDYNGLIDGMTMLEGNLALHRGLREALPGVALSGEGLDEVTYRHEAFAQRHVMGVNHSDGTFDRGMLDMAHPISSYLLRPFTTLYGYLGMAPPSNGQLYAAWQEAYEHYGVIPTIKAQQEQLWMRTGFDIQSAAEAGFWQLYRVDADVERYTTWPADLAFPFRTAAGHTVWRTAEHCLKDMDEAQPIISRTVTGVSEVEVDGSVPDWRAYDGNRILGLDPEQWYPVFRRDPEDEMIEHVSAMPKGFTLGGFGWREAVRFFRFVPSSDSTLRLGGRVADAVCGERYFRGGAKEVKGELHSASGALFYGGGSVIYGHPPYKVEGGGVAYGRFALTLPKQAARFVSEVAMDAAATGEGRSDGVTYGVTLRCGDEQAHAELLNAGSERKELALDMRPFAGKDVTLELSIDPGPAHNPSYDWARCYDPRIECDMNTIGTITLSGRKDAKMLLSSEECIVMEPTAEAINVRTALPGTVYLLKNLPETPALPLALKADQATPSFLDDAGAMLERPMHACVANQAGLVGGVERQGLFVHPPDHGQTIADFPMALPALPAQFHAFLGIRDGGKSSGVLFRVEVNGRPLESQLVQPGVWHETTCDLSPWAGKPIVLSLITDSAGDFVCDWAHWGEAEIQAKKPLDAVAVRLSQ